MSEFIKVTKGDEIIEISPLALADHKRLGWILWDEQAQAAIDKAVADAQAVQAKAAADAKVPAGKKAAVSPSKGNS